MKTTKITLALAAMLFAPLAWGDSSCPCPGDTHYVGTDACGNDVCDSDDIDTYPYTDACGNGVCEEPEEGLECCGGVEVYDPEEKCCDGTDLYTELQVDGDGQICVSTLLNPENRTTLSTSSGVGPYSWSTGDSGVAKIVGASTGASVVIESGGSVGQTLVSVEDVNGCQGQKAVSTTYDDLTGFSHYSNCGSLFQNPVFPPTTNGCSGPIGPYVEFVPEDSSFPTVNFTVHCDSHDICYSTCPSAKNTCDNNFLNDLDGECFKYPAGSDDRSDCLLVSASFYAAVTGFGNPFFVDAQVKHCACCDEV